MSNTNWAWSGSQKVSLHILKNFFSFLKDKNILLLIGLSILLILLILMLLSLVQEQNSFLIYSLVMIVWLIWFMTVFFVHYWVRKKTNNQKFDFKNAFDFVSKNILGIVWVFFVFFVIVIGVSMFFVLLSQTPYLYFFSFGEITDWINLNIAWFMILYPVFSILVYGFLNKNILSKEYSRCCIFQNDCVIQDFLSVFLIVFMILLLIDLESSFGVWVYTANVFSTISVVSMWVSSLIVTIISYFVAVIFWIDKNFN